MTNIDATHISAKVTVTTTKASRMIPPGPSANNRGFWIQRNPIALAFLLSAAIIIFLIGASAKNRRLSTVMAFVALATIAMTMAACGGGGGGGGGGGNAGTPTGVSTPTLTAMGGSTTHSLNFTLIVE
jgi:hypothetical protein